ncbi:MAG TPA: phage protease [Phycisphaerae bacterium]|nr:phage protease [Phycisphaerae bacterium]
MQDKMDETRSDDRLQVERVALEASTLGQEEAPRRIMISPWGEVKSSAGSFVVDEEAAGLTIAAFTEHGTDLPVDYEHQTLGGAYSSPSGQAPAAGWIKALSAVPPGAAGREGAPAEAGLWADVEWTAEAREKLRSKEYRYLSPVALVRRSDRRLVGLHSVALTNKPAIVGMRPVVGSDAAAAPGKEAQASAAAELREVLSLDQAADDGVVLVAAAERIRTLERAESIRQATDRVSQAMSAGRLTAAQKEWAMSLALRDPAEFDRWLEAAPVVVPLGRLSPPRVDAVEGKEASRRAAESAARAEWRANRQVLEKICTEEAYVAAAVREVSAR